MKILPVCGEFFHANVQTEGQTDMTKLTVTFLKLCTMRELRQT
jgi:hypothetical protein